MKQLIKISQTKITCDNPKCNYALAVDKSVDIYFFVNKSCPKCGTNLLTETDYILHLKAIRLVKFINKWFGWLSYFYSKSAWKQAYVYTHNKISIKLKNNKCKKN